MNLIRLEGASKDFGLRTLFRDLDLTVSAGDRLGLIGPNGAGYEKWAGALGPIFEKWELGK